MTSVTSTAAAASITTTAGQAHAATPVPSPVPSPVMSRIRAVKVAHHQRLGFLPRMFGPRHFLRGEQTIYAWARLLCPAYEGGYWEFFELGNGGFYMAPELPGPLQLRVETNDFEGSVSADTAGVIVSLFAINHLLFQGCDHLVTQWDRLHDYACGRADAPLILRAID